MFIVLNGHMLCPSILIRRWYWPAVMGISYVNVYCFKWSYVMPFYTHPPLVLARRYGHFIDNYIFNDDY
jgi:hypothetical protein